MRTSYHVIDTPVGGENPSFFEEFHRMLELVHKATGIRLQLVNRRESSSQIVLVFSDDTEKLRVEMWDDYIGETRHLMVRANDESVHDRVVELLRQELAVLSNQECLKKARQSMQSEPNSLYLVAYSAPDAYENENFELIMDAVQSDSPALRIAGAGAISILGWPQFKAELEELYDDEKPGQVKVAMERALNAFRM